MLCSIITTIMHFWNNNKEQVNGWYRNWMTTFFKEHGKRGCPCYQIQFWTKIKHALDVHHNGKKMKEWRRKQPQKSKKGCCLEENIGTNLYLPKGESHTNTRVGRRSKLGTNFLDNIATRSKMNFPLHTSFYTPIPNN